MLDFGDDQLYDPLIIEMVATNIRHRDLYGSSIQGLSHASLNINENTAF
jgi:hypothetical protein